MLAEGVYFGVREGSELVAAAGTHLVVPGEGVAAIGNVYTRRDRRGRGLAGRLTGTVAVELVGRGLRTVALNVNQNNATALGVYERLGFVRYCAFVEGLAVRR
jgi:predicted GNAT family acetyltransferase